MNRGKLFLRIGIYLRRVGSGQLDYSERTGREGKGWRVNLLK